MDLIATKSIWANFLFGCWTIEYLKSLEIYENWFSQKMFYDTWDLLVFSVGMIWIPLQFMTTDLR